MLHRKKKKEIVEKQDKLWRKIIQSSLLFLKFSLISPSRCRKRAPVYVYHDRIRSIEESARLHSSISLVNRGDYPPLIRNTPPFPSETLRFETAITFERASKRIKFIISANARGSLSQFRHEKQRGGHRGKNEKRSTLMEKQRSTARGVRRL